MNLSLSNFLSGLQMKSGLTADQARFAFTVFLCFPLGFIFRTCASTRTVSPKIRHYLSFTLGVGLLLFCFGRQSFHILISSSLAFLLMHCIDESVVHKYVFTWAMLYLSFVHIMRLLVTEGYVIDISGPLMFATVKITYVGFGIHDSYTKEKTKEMCEQINNSAEEMPPKIHKPTLLEYMSYIFHFSSVFCGPPSEFHDYKAFIEMIQFNQSKKPSELSPMIPALRKGIFGYMLVATYVMLAPYYLPKFVGDTKRLSQASLISNMFFAEMVVYLSKAKYISAFMIGEAANNMAGFGFNGYDKEGNAHWDKLIMHDVIGLEKARNIREVVNCWNIGTNTWLRQCIYMRVSFMPMLVTWCFSAIWHGFHPGYYMFFVSIGIALIIARKVHRKIRPYFLISQRLKTFYDVITLIVTRLIINYFACAFSMTDVYGTLRFWRAAHYYGHVLILLGILLVIVLPDIKNSSRQVNGNAD